jgi:hypothetical protein
MLRPRPDLEEKLVAGLREGPTELPSEIAEQLDPFQYVASANYVVPMLLDLAIAHGNEIVDAVPSYSSLDHSTNWSTLLSAVSRFDGFAMPYFERSLAADPFAGELLAHEENKRMRLHVASSFEQGLWSLVEDEDGLRIHLAPRARRSALVLVANKAGFLGANPEVQEIMRRGDEVEIEDYTLALGMDALAVFRESCPDAWRRLLEGLPFREEVVPYFRAFVIRLSLAAGVRWMTRERMWEHWSAFAEAKGAPEIERDEWEALVDFNAVTPEEGLDWGVQAALIRFGDTFAVWPFVFHVLHPDLNFLTLLIRRNEALWGRTLGADLALVADRMVARLPADGRFIVRARRRRKGVGEVDLALLDRATGDVLVAELKTVFDRFRSHVQLSNYSEQRVNFTKATGQARRAADAIRSGEWSLHDLFGKEAPASPRSVTPALLTWWDTYNPTLDSADPIICANFAAFEYLLGESDHLSDLTTALEELAQIYCPVVFDRGVARIDGEELQVRREVQTDILPPLDPDQLSPLTRDVLDGIRRLPMDPRLIKAESEEEIPVPY